MGSSVIPESFCLIIWATEGVYTTYGVGVFEVLLRMTTPLGSYNFLELDRSFFLALELCKFWRIAFYPLLLVGVVHFSVTFLVGSATLKEF